MLIIPSEEFDNMWLQLRLYLLIGIMFSILYGIIIGISYFLGYSGFNFFIIATGISLAFIFIQYLIGPKIIEWSMHVHYVNESEYPKLHYMVAELSDQAGLPKKPKIGISKLQIPNAFAFGRTKRGSRVCVTEGILHILNDEELKAVLGHEISHIKHRDIVVITMLSAIPMICYMIYLSLFWGGMRGGRSRDGGGAIAIGIAALVLYFITNLLVMYGSRIREYYADRGSTELRNEPRHLATALYKLAYNSAKIPKTTLKQTEGMKAFFLNDPSRAMQEVRELKDIDLDMSGTIDQHELDLLSTQKIKLHTGDKLLEILSTHPNMAKRIKHLSKLSLGKDNLF